MKNTRTLVLAVAVVVIAAIVAVAFWRKDNRQKDEATVTQNLTPVVTAIPDEDGQDMDTVTPISSASPEEAATQEPAEKEMPKPTQLAEPSAKPAQTEKPLSATPVSTEAPTAIPTEEPTAVPTAEPTAAPTAAPTPAPTEAPKPKPAYGSIPFNLAAGTSAWFQIDATDSAYTATREQINAIRAEGGLPALTMSSDLSNAANARCESFVAGGPFDHSRMTTLSEICAKGAIGSAQTVCTAWKGSPDHYANIMRTDISQMGVACWFCSTSQGNYTYWTVTFG